jgi:hypothetical protein
MQGLSIGSTLLVALTAAISEPPLPGWMEVPIPHPSSRAWSCANASNSWYLEPSANDTLKAVCDRQRRVEDPIPFTIPPADDRYGNRHVVQISSGWLVGFDAGEFGGGLWWYPTASAEGARVRLPVDTPAHPQDYYKADNVRGFGRVNGELVVLMGLDHMGGRSGRVFQVKLVETEVLLVPWAVLDGSPSAWIADEKSLLVVTDSSVYLLSRPNTATVVHTFSGELGGLYPTSIVRTDNGRLYIGLRRYIIGLTPLANKEFRERWWVPGDSLNIADRCDCVARD